MKSFLLVLALAGQLGLIIAIPVALLGFGGAYLDKVVDTSPLFVLLGLFVAVISSAAMVYRLVKKIDPEN